MQINHDPNQAYDPTKEDQGSNRERIKKGIMPIPPAEIPPVPVDDPPPIEEPPPPGEDPPAPREDPPPIDQPPVIGS